MKKILSMIIAVVLIFGTTACVIETDEEYIEMMESGATIVEAIDVGQGDAFLISNASFGNIMIDTGDNEHKEDLVYHLKTMGITTIDHLILTHPHSDHIGGASALIDNFEVKEMYMPRMTHNIKTFKNLVEKMEENDLYFNEAKSGVTIKLGSGSSIYFLSPTKGMPLDDLDNSDAVCMLKSNGKKVLFTADVWDEIELMLIPRIGDIDILKIAHHGSYKGTAEETLYLCEPEYAMIGVGEDNSYGHPSKETIKKLNKYGVETYRTDKHGNIRFILGTDGSIEVKTSK